MTYIQYTEHGTIAASATWKVDDDWVVAPEEVVRGYDGALYLKSQAPVKPEEMVSQENATQIRSERNNLLSATDYLMLSDAPITAEQHTELVAYRQALRDVTAQAGFPNNVEWPVKPEL